MANADDRFHEYAWCVHQVHSLTFLISYFGLLHVSAYGSVSEDTVCDRVCVCMCVRVRVCVCVCVCFARECMALHVRMWPWFDSAYSVGRPRPDIQEAMGCFFLRGMAHVRRSYRPSIECMLAVYVFVAVHAVDLDRSAGVKHAQRQVPARRDRSDMIVHVVCSCSRSGALDTMYVP